MNIFKYKKKNENITADDVINFIKKHQKTLTKKCKKSYSKGDFNSGRWWDCQSCAILTLLDELKKEFKR